MKTRNSIFRSVFPAPSKNEVPTPSATPQIDSGSFARSEPKVSFEDHEDEDIATRNTRWERAWHYATSSLLLPTSAFSPPDQGNETAIDQVWNKRWGEESKAAVAYLARHDSLIESYAGTYDSRALIQWYGWEVTRHFVTYQLPVLVEIFQDDDVRTALTSALQLLEFTQAIYLYPLTDLMLSHLGPLGQQHYARFRDWHHALVAKALDSSGYSECLTSFLKLRVRFIFEASKHEAAIEDHTSDLFQQSTAVINQLKRVTEMLNKVGLGGAQAQQVYAEVLDESVSLHIVDEFSWPNVSGTGSQGRLAEWINTVLAPLLHELTKVLGNVDYTPDPQRQAKFNDELESWRTRATHELAARRLTEAFGIIANWGDAQSASQEDSQDQPQNVAATGLEEMATFFHTATGRAHVASKLINTINHRLLMPGAATIEILRVYVNIFLAFSEIDKTGLLLARIIRPIRRYLRERSDTVKIIIQALLLDHAHHPTDDDALNSFAQLVQDLHEPAPTDDESKPLYDLQWNPDPVDAAPEWRPDDRPEMFTKLIEIFDAKDIFVKEFQNTLSASLLKDPERGGGNESEADRDRSAARTLEDEIRVLELFKAHLGEGPLQACEVMLKDIHDSQRTNEVIKKEQFGSAQAGTAISARILSRFYWPTLNREHMLVPATVERVQARYEAGFEAYKPARKLTWLQNLGHARVALQLKDRVVEEVVQTWQASVIYAFGSDDEGPDGQAVRKTVDDLVEQLQMDDELIEAALTYWTAKRVLRKDGDAWEVLEELPMQAGNTQAKATTGKGATEAGQGDGDNSASAAAAASAAEAAGLSAIRRSEQKAVEEKMAIFWQFTVNMLKNQGAMPLQGIIMRLNMVVPGGFPFTNDEFKAYLSKHVEDGRLELAGGKYKVVK